MAALIKFSRIEFAVNLRVCDVFERVIGLFKPAGEVASKLVQSHSQIRARECAETPTLSSSRVRNAALKPLSSACGIGGVTEILERHSDRGRQTRCRGVLRGTKKAQQPKVLGLIYYQGRDK